ncbi:MAG TPA: MlaD family protein, partial [Marmoricola sp.]|nr:MlaD family protein [Marmoricola sp.]
RPDPTILRLGAISLAVLLLVMAAAFNLQKFPGFRGTGYHADFKDASGLARGDMVQIGGVKVGKVDDIEIHSDHVRVNFEVHGADFGTQTRASVEVLNLLGTKYLNLTPAGPGQMEAGSTIPLARTRTTYDVVSTLSQLTTKTEQLDTDQLATALKTLAGTVDASAPEVHQSFTGISRLSASIASRNSEVTALLQHADDVTKLLAQRKGDLVTLMKQANLVFEELQARKQAIHRLLVGAQVLADTLKGIADDNRGQIGSALADLHEVTSNLRAQTSNIQATIHNLKPYASVLINVLGTGPWFDAYVPNLVGMATGEFVPGKR